MTAAAAFNISLVLRSDVASAKAGLAEVTSGLRNVSAEAGKTSAVTAKEAAELERLAAAAGKAALAQGDLVAAEKRTQAARAQTQILPLANPVAQAAQVAPAAAIWRQSETAAESLRGVVSGLNVTMGQQAHEMLEAAQASAAYQSALDNVRAQFNPLFAASRQYEQQLERIADAERLGAITAREAAAARMQAANAIAPAVPGGIPGGNRANIPNTNTANVAAQGFDIGVTAAMGMNPAMIGLQQGTQLVQLMQQMGGGKTALQGIAAGFASILNPMSLATIGIVAFGAAGIQAFMKLGGETKSFEDALADLESSVDAYAKSSDRARLSSAALREEFGSMSEVARELLKDMADLDRRSAGRDANAVVRGLAQKNGLALKNPEGEADDLRSFFGLSTWKQESWDLARGVRDAYSTAIRAEGLDNQIAGAERLKDAYLAAAEASGGISKEEDAGLANIQTVLDQLVELKSKDENAAGNARADEMVRQLRQRVELEQVALQYGQKSSEYRAAERAQLRQNTVLELERLGLTEKDQKAKAVLAALAGESLALDAAATKARQDAQREYLQGQDDQIAALQRQGTLLGASREDQARINALADADLEIRRRSLSLDDAREVKAKAIAKAEAEITLERQKAMRAVQVQSQADAIDGQIALARDPVSKANLEFQKEFGAQVADGQAPMVAYAEALRVRNRAMQDATTSTQTQIADMLSEVAIRRDLADQVAAGTITSTDANRILREELELRPLIAAAARAEGAEKQRLIDLIEGMRVAYAAMAAEEQRQNQNDYLRGQAARTQQLQLELALLGQTAEVRARVLAMARAEQDIQRLGLKGDAADEVRRREALNLELTRTIEAQADAWERVQSAGEAAIDGVLDKLKSGDVKGAFADLFGEIESGFFDLAIRNPLKNALLGTNLGTFGDAGGWSGIMDRFTGRAPIDERALISNAAMPVQSMVVTAANVTLAGNLSGFGTAANANFAPVAGVNTNAAPLTYGSLPGSSDVQTQIWQFFAAKGLAPHQIAGILGNASAESGFNPAAVGDGGTSFGLFQHHAGRGQGLLGAVGGMGGLGDVQGQLQYVWQELMTTEMAAMKRLLSSTDVRGATEAWASYERPAGYSAANPAGSMHFDRRLAAAEQALAQFGVAAQTAGGTLNQSAGVAAAGLTQAGQGAAVASQGMGAFGQLLSGIGGMVGGDTGNVLGAIVSIGGSLFNGVPLFRDGGATGGSNPDRAAGIVHEGEYVFDAAATSRIGISNLEGIRRGTMRGFRSGGLVSSLPSPATPAANQTAPAANRPDKLHVSVDVSGARGDREIEMMVQQAVSSAVAQGIEIYDREALPARVRQVANDRWGG